MMKSQKFRNKITGEIATQIPLMEMSQWEKYNDGKPVHKTIMPIQPLQQMHETLLDSDVKQSTKDTYNKMPLSRKIMTLEKLHSKGMFKY